MRRVLNLLCIVFIGFSCQGQEAAIINISIEEAVTKLQNEDVILIDVRTDGEYASGHLEGCQHINIGSKSFEDGIQKLSKNKRYIVYCHAGGRSAKACKIMKEMGFVSLYNLDGGISAWKQANQPIVMDN